MKAITVEPHNPDSARLDDVPEPDMENGSVLVSAVAVGVCGTDVEIVEGKYGTAPRGKTRLVLGHESLGQVLARADRAWLARLVTRREPPQEFASALKRLPDDIKVVVQFAEAP